jgi:hypothetical protein
VVSAVIMLFDLNERFYFPKKKKKKKKKKNFLKFCKNTQTMGGAHTCRSHPIVSESYDQVVIKFYPNRPSYDKKMK